ncbi:MAG TPA: branched-chain amino acid ABC transporter substrate-binding protein [Candidatus Acidoferrales bacterium]|nr:branched-chain amino acid ABC transporter substrate-binding protein [Candidatus Acidoferrales bacterium]
MSRPRFPLRLSPLLLLVLVFSFGCGPGAVTATNGGGATIVIGADLPLSGADPSLGPATLDGIRFALQQRGSLDGFTVAVQPMDDAVNQQPDPSKGVLNLLAMSGQPGLVAVIGPLTSSLAQAEIPASNPTHLALVSPSAAGPCLTQNLPNCLQDYGYSPALLRPSGENNFFRLSGPDNWQGPAMADFARSTLHLSRVAVWDDQEAFGKMLAGTFSTQWVKNGGQVVSHQSYDPTAPGGLDSLLADAKSTGAQAIYLGANSSARVCAAAGQQSVLPGVYWLGASAITDDACATQASKAPSGHLLATLGYEDPAQLPAQRGLLQAYRRQFPQAQDLGPYTFAAYDATNLIIAAIERVLNANSNRLPSPAQVLTAIAQTKNFRGLGASLGFAPNGDLTRPIFQIEQLRARAGVTARWSFRQQFQVPELISASGS